MKVYAVVNVWVDEMFGGCETSVVSPMYTTREEAEKHMYAREDKDDRIREYEVKEKFEGLKRRKASEV